MTFFSPAIFAQANKTVNDLRQQVAKKESEINGLQAKLDDFKEQESRSILEKDESQSERKFSAVTNKFRALIIDDGYSAGS